jgi:drug/metabolite transporter (DMT)-like permease
VSAVTLALLAAFVNAGTAILSKSLATRYPARAIIGVLLLMNCLILLPFAPFVVWRWSAEIVVLHVASAALLVLASVPVWDMFDAGAASATSTAQALSPIAAAIGAALLIPGSVSALQLAAALVVVVGVIYALRDAFGQLGRRGSIVRIVASATGVGLLTVTSKLLADQGVGVVETYVVRTGLGAAALLIFIPPRGVPLDAAPRLFVRSVAVTAYYAITILAVQRGSPLVVQTIIAITPLLTLGYESLRDRAWPATRALAGAVLVAIGVAVVMLA